MSNETLFAAHGIGQNLSMFGLNLKDLAEEAKNLQALTAAVIAIGTATAAMWGGFRWLFPALAKKQRLSGPHLVGSFWDYPLHKKRPRDGVTRKARPLGDGPSERPPRDDVLIVLVHGLFGDCEGTWAKFPRLLVESLGSEAEMFSYQYPARLFQPASIETAAEHLMNILRSSRYRRKLHLVFVTHSAGGLVVRKLLAIDAREDAAIETHREELFAAGRPAFDEAERANVEDIRRHSVISRTRLIVNIAVPHAGEHAWLARLTKRIYCKLKWILARLENLPGDPDRKRWGVNHILEQVLPLSENPWLAELQRRHSTMMEDRRRRSLPVPRHVEIRGTNDEAVPAMKGTEPVPVNIEIRGSHALLKEIESENSLLVDVVTKPIRPYLVLSNRSSLAVAATTVAATHHFDRNRGIKQLVSLKPDEPISRRSTLEYATADAQYGVFEQVLAWLDGQGPEDRPPVAVVTGAAQVGKSTVLRRISQELGRRYLSDPDQPFVLHITLGRMTLFSSRERLSGAFVDRDRLWSSICDAWIAEARWRTALLDPGASIDNGWLVARLRHGNVVLVLDGLDEFLSHHSMATLDHFSSIFKDISDAVTTGSTVWFVVGVRSTQHGLSRLTRHISDTFEVVRLSPDEATEMFAGANALLNSVLEPGFKRTLLTPYLMSTVAPRLPGNAVGQIQTRGGLFEFILDSIVEHDQVFVNDDTLRDREIVKDILAAIGWVMFSQFRGDIPEVDLLPELIELFQSGPSQITRLQNIYKPEKIHRLLLRTIFYEGQGFGWRFEHPTWAEYLAARYLVLCLRSLRVHEFGVRGTTHPISLMIADQLCVNEPIRKALVERVFMSLYDKTLAIDRGNGEWTTSPRGEIIAANFASLFSSLRSDIDDDAMIEVERCFEQPRLDITRHLFSAGTVYRVLKRRGSDAGLERLEKWLCSFLKRLLNTHRNPFLASNAWCTLRMLKARGHYDGDLPIFEWQDCVNRPEFDDGARRLVVQALGYDDTSADRFIQEGLLTAVKEIVYDPELIMCVHYLYAISCAKQIGRLERHLYSDLDFIYRDDGSFSTAIQRWVDQYDSEEIRFLYQRGKEVWKS